MKAYYVNKKDYNHGDYKVSPIFSNKEQAEDYLIKEVLPKSNNDDVIRDTVEITMTGNIYRAYITRASLMPDGSVYNSWSWPIEYELIEEEVM